MTTDTHSILTLQCPDQPGIVAAVANLIADVGGNIMNADQHTDRDSAVFLQRIEIDGSVDWAAFDLGLAQLIERFSMQHTLHRPGNRDRVVIACSAELYCAADLLTRASLGELDINIVAIVSDKPAAGELAAQHGVPFRLVDGGLAGDSRAAQEAAFAAVLDELEPDLVVLARYMRILPEVITRHWN